ncbi:hypothetical protein BPNPMPFG_005626 [Mesorhizobium sp. AR07]|uniref:hypothetical protein n=1 Tax=Mesorhizobium sp. AR07 TaxID=2865838 RepID=UPI00215FCEE4|nr:hypothetical protein [Mesorhizobium sp. AR07]UVK43788.1 hypothetical protein BPNPMPFG_005626 [Mesorhizobium sp. AR07]
MPRKPKDEMLPAVRGIQLDLDDRDAPTMCLVGLLTVDRVKSFTLREEGVRIMMTALQGFLDRIDRTRPAPTSKGLPN